VPIIHKGSLPEQMVEEGRTSLSRFTWKMPLKWWWCGGLCLSNRQLSTEAILKFNPLHISNVRKVTKNSVRLDDTTLQDSSDRKVQMP